MRKLFAAAALATFGATIAFLPAPAEAKNRENKAHYYFLSPTALARDIANKGLLRNVVIDGASLNFTHNNQTGRKPVKNATLVWFGFGRRPAETILVVNSATYKEHLKRMGRKRPASVLIETAAARPVPASFTSAVTRPQDPTDTFNPKKRLG